MGVFELWGWDGVLGRNNFATKRPYPFRCFAPPVRAAHPIRRSSKSALGAFASPQILKMQIVVDLKEKRGLSSFL
jgi:hypothetical protein